MKTKDIDKLLMEIAAEDIRPSETLIKATRKKIRAKDSLLYGLSLLIAVSAISMLVTIVYLVLYFNPLTITVVGLIGFGVMNLSLGLVYLYKNQVSQFFMELEKASAFG